MSLTSNPISDAASERATKTVQVIFNRRTIPMPKGKHTGSEIKAFAIMEGIAIEASFILAMKKGNKFHDVADNEVVNVTKGDEFSATAGDDNS
jgi:hypothetical protein